MPQLVMRVDAVSACRTCTDIRFDDDGVTDGIEKVLGGRKGGRTDEACRRDARFLVVRLHGGFTLDVLHVCTLPARADVEVRAQTGVIHEPVLIVGLEPVNASVLEREEADGAQHLVIVVECGDKVVLGQCLAHLTRELVVGRVADAENVYPFFL